MKMNKKGFTIVELVIVIAVIAILAAVLIPTFSSVTSSARASAAQQQAKAGLDSILALTEGVLPEGTLFCITNSTDAAFDYAFVYSGNKLTQVAADEAEVETYGTTGEYAVYVSASCFTSSENSTEVTAASKNKTATEKLLLNIFKSRVAACKDITGVTISSALATGKDYYTLSFAPATKTIEDPDTEEETTITISYPTVRIYYTSDIQETQVVFIGND